MRLREWTVGRLLVLTEVAIPAAMSSSTSTTLSPRSTAALNMALTSFCLKVSSCRATCLRSQSGCATRGTGLSSFCSAAGMVMIFWMALSRRVR